MNNQTDTMQTTKANKVSINTILWVAVISGLILLVPAISMQLTDTVNWQTGDFIVMGVLLFSFGCVGTVLWQKLNSSQLVLGITVLVLSFLYIWVELAVGVFTDIGS